MAIRDSRIVATGTTADIVKLAGAGTEQVNLAGKTVLPGLIDAVTPVQADEVGFP